MTGIAEIRDEAEKLNLVISADIVVQHGTENSMYQKSIDALKSGNRAFIVFLHSSDVLLLAKAMEEAANFLQIDETPSQSPFILRKKFVVISVPIR